MSEHEVTPIDAEQLTELVRDLQRRIPEFQQLTNEQMIALRKAASLDPLWVNETVTTLGACSAVRQAVNATHEDLRAEVEAARRWDSVEANLYALLKGVAAANLVRRHRLGVKALQIYGIARQLVRQPEHHGLATYVERLQRMNRLGKRKKTAPATEEAG